MKKIRVAVIFGGTNTEHEISIITALQAMHALKEYGHDVYPIYISKEGSWHAGGKELLQPETFKNLNELPKITQPVRSEKHANQNVLVSPNLLNQARVIQHFDVALPIFHGKYGEDGSIQGFFQMLNIPIAGSNLLSASIGIDKWLSKRLAASLGIPVLNDILINRHQWIHQKNETLTFIHNALKGSVIIKPSRLGSSIGITPAKTESELMNALDVAFTLDSRVMIEKLLEKPMEVQISILGNDPYELSVTEQPLSGDQIYSYEEKYLKGEGKKNKSTKGMASASRVIPAPISSTQDKMIQNYTESFYRAIGGKGLSRVDYLLSQDTIYFNEINVIPGSLSFYLWEKSGKPFPELMHQLVTIALEANKEDQQLVKSFESNILAGFALPIK